LLRWPRHDSSIRTQGQASPGDQPKTNTNIILVLHATNSPSAASAVALIVALAKEELLTMQNTQNFDQIKVTGDTPA
jgi:hypothetical protein